MNWRQKEGKKKSREGKKKKGSKKETKCEEAAK